MCSFGHSIVTLYLEIQFPQVQVQFLYCWLFAYESFEGNVDDDDNHDYNILCFSESDPLNLMHHPCCTIIVIIWHLMTTIILMSGCQQCKATIKIEKENMIDLVFLPYLK